METMYERRDGYVMVSKESGGQVWMGRSCDQDGDSFLFETAVACADNLRPLTATMPTTPCIRVDGVRLFTARLMEVVLWVDTEAAVDVGAVQIAGVPGLLILGADRVAILATCSDGNEPETVLL